MNAASSEPTSQPDSPPECEVCWSKTRWIVYLILAFGLHVGLIYTLSNRKPTAPRPVKNDVKLSVALTRSEFLELQDPTVFAGPHPRGFAAQTWLKSPVVPYPGFRWTEPPRLLALATEELGILFLSQPQITNSTPPKIEIPPTPTLTTLPPLAASAAITHSTLRITGPLAKRKLENQTPLPLQKAQDGLTNSVVQILVDGTGRTFSPTLMPPGSGSREADQLALKLATDVRFAPLQNSSHLAVGALIFEWQTSAITNQTAAPAE